MEYTLWIGTHCIHLNLCEKRNSPGIKLRAINERPSVVHGQRVPVLGLHVTDLGRKSNFNFELLVRRLLAVILAGGVLGQRHRHPDKNTQLHCSLHDDCLLFFDATYVRCRCRGGFELDERTAKTEFASAITVQLLIHVHVATFPPVCGVGAGRVLRLCLVNTKTKRSEMGMPQVPSRLDGSRKWRTWCNVASAASNLVLKLAPCVIIIWSPKTH